MSAIKREERIGDCRLILGDCIEVMPELGPIDVVMTDPPYGMSFRSNYRKSQYAPIANDESDDLLQFACEGHGHHSNYIWMRWDNLRGMPPPKSLITWVKDNHSMGDLAHEHGRKTEVCAFYPGPDHWFPSGRPTDVVHAPRTGNPHHPTQKPIALMEKVMLWTVGDVLDPFMGSGTTLVACAKLGRKGIGIELDTDYFEIACERVHKAYQQLDLFVAPPSAPVQQGMDL